MSTRKKARTTTSRFVSRRTSAPTDTGFIQTDTAAVSDQAVIANPGLPISAQEGKSTNLVLLATFTDPGGAEALSEYSADVNWGDSTPLDSNTVIVAGANGQFVVLGSHVYGKESPAGGFLVTTTIHHLSEVTPNPIDTVVNQSAIVSDQQITNLATTSLPANGQEVASIGAITGIATFTDPARRRLRDRQRFHRDRQLGR